MQEIVSQISLVPNFRVEFVRISRKSCISEDLFDIEMTWISSTTKETCKRKHIRPFHFVI